MHLWEKIYKENKFKITTLQPSVVVKANENIFSNNIKVLDIGCGNGRNSIFSAEKGCLVDAIDVADTRWLYFLVPVIRKRINFQKINIDDFNWESKKYDVVLLLRVIQYLSSAQIEKLIKNIKEHLSLNSILLVSYVEKGGAQNRPEVDVPKFSHNIKYVKKLLEKYFSRVDIKRGAQVSIHVKYKEPIVSYDIKCVK